MSDKSLKEKTISGMIWSTVGRFGTMALSFVSNLVLARLLMPGDFGVIGMLHVFIAVSSVFVTAGFGSALIQKKNVRILRQHQRNPHPLPLSTGQ